MNDGSPLTIDRSSKARRMPEGAWRSQCNVWHALILHDIKSRFFGNGTGYLITILWPAVHIAVILAINMGRLPPYGSSMILYASTAVVPYIAANYIGRFVMLGVLTNKAYLQYPIVKPLDLMTSRIFLEIVANFIIIICLLCTMMSLNIDVLPNDTMQAAQAYVVSLLLGLGAGVLGGTVTLAFPLFQLIFVLLIIAAWVTCGIGFDPELLPEPYGYWMSFNPVLHTVEWLRLAYYPNFHARLLDRAYPVEFGGFCLAAGLLTERIGRAFWTRSR